MIDPTASKERFANDIYRLRFWDTSRSDEMLGPRARKKRFAKDTIRLRFLYIPGSF